MTRIQSLVAAIAVASAIAGNAFGAEPFALPRQDQKMVPVTAYAPATDSCRGTALISPGAGGSEKHYVYLGEAMSAQGYLAVVIGHQESGLKAVRQRLRGNGVRDALSELITDPQAYEGRFMDIAAVKQWAKARCSGAESILLGHSMGAATVMIEAGAKNRLGVNGSNAFDAYIALSPQGVGSIFPPNAWQGIGKPVLSLTGTRDDELGGASWENRTEPFKDMRAGCKWLGVVDGATHQNFGGRRMSRKTEALTIQTIQAFLQGVRSGDCKAPQPSRGIDVQVK